MVKRPSYAKKTFFIIVSVSIFVFCWFAAGLNPHSLVPLLAFAINLCVGAFVYSRDKKRNLYRVFALWNIVLALHNLLIFGLYVAPNPTFAKVWSQITGPGYYLIPATSFHFVLVFTKSKSDLKKIVLFATYCIGVALSIFPLVPPFENEYTKIGIKYFPKGNLPYTVSMIILVVVCTGAVLQVLYAFLRASSRHERSQYKYLLFAGAVALIIGSANYLVAYGVDVYPASSLAFLIYALILAYAILKRRFLDIEVVIRKSMVYASLTLLIAGGYAGMMIVSNTIFNIASPTTSIPLNAAAIVAIAFVFQPLRVRIQSFVDRRFFREKYNYRETLREFSAEIVKTIGIEDLALRLVNVVTDTIKVEGSSLVLYNSEVDAYETVAEKRFGLAEIFCNPASRKKETDLELMGYLGEEEQVLDREELKFRLEGSTGKEAKERLIRLVELLEKRHAEIALPIFLKKTFRGAFFMGKKLSEEDYSTDDIELLQIIVNQTAIAIENSELYDKTLSMKRYYDNIVKSMTSGMLTLDAMENVVTLNEAGERILGHKAEDIKKRNVTEVFSKNKEFVKAILDTLSADSGREVTYNEVEVVYRNETERTLAVTTSLLKGQKNETVGVVALFNDITEKKELERQIERSKRLAYLGEMAANIAHEIKNPIGSIRLFVDALSRDFNNPLAQKNFKEVIPQEVENIDHMIRELLFLARPPSLIKVDLDLVEIVKLSVRLCAEGASVKNVTLETELPDCVVSMLADGEKLKQVLRNIILNAIDAVPSGNGRVVVRLEESATEVRMAVSDNGCGIPEDVASHLFHPFFTTKHTGTGLGLAIANRIVEDHGGVIEVNSKVGTGTTFTIKIPRQKVDR
jgi:PAS domain S-box-containing protein